jgi:hypothetical protein
LTQLPRLPVTPHDWQVPVQAPLQQYPSTQYCDPQSVLAVQTSPLGFLFIAQVPVRQYCIGWSQGVVALWSTWPVGIREQLPSEVGRLQA